MGNKDARYAGALCRARDLLMELQIREPGEIDIENIAAYKDAPVRYAPLEGCDGRMVRLDDQALITVRDSITRQGQRRFVIAHELGHVLLHPNVRQMDEVDRGQARNFDYYQAAEELEANYFAAELLMPRRFFSLNVKGTEPGWDTVEVLADRYRTTLAATAAQYVHCSDETVFLIASMGGEWKWFVASERTEGFYITETRRLHRYTCAYELLNEDKTHSRAQDVAAGAWFRGFDPNGKECVTEDSMRASNSDFVMTLLWVREAI